MAGDRVLRYSRAYAKGYFATVLLVHSQPKENSKKLVRTHHPLARRMLGLFLT